MAGRGHRRRGRRSAPIRLSPLVLLALAVLLASLLALPGRRAPHLGARAPAPTLPDGPATRAAISALNAAFLAEVKLALAEGPLGVPTLMPPEKDGVLLPHWRDIIAISVVGGLPLEEAFYGMVLLVRESVAADGRALALQPAADGTLARGFGAEGTRLQVRVLCRSAEEGAGWFRFTRTARRALSRLLDDTPERDWRLLLGGAPEADGESSALCAALPVELAATRRAVVESACGLVGRVGYFWGGKSGCAGWDTRWGAPALVCAPGIAESGTVMPYGLDCSGLVSWAAVSATGAAGAYGAAGDGVRAQFARCDAVAWADALPGDLLFFSDLSHVGIVAARREAGALVAVHCARSRGGVVISQDAAATGFAAVGRPRLYAAYPG